MDRECKCSLPYEVNGKYVYEGKSQKILIDQVKLSMCETIYIDNSQNTFRKIIGVNFSNLLSLLKNYQK